MSNTELKGTFQKEFYRSENGSFAIGTLRNRMTVKGECEPGDLIPGCEYTFFGKQVEHPTYGKQFEYTCFRKIAPKSQNEVVAFLTKSLKLPGIGPVLAHTLCDKYGADFAVPMLRDDPSQVAKDIPRLTVDQAEAASRILKEDIKFEDAKIELAGLLHGRGFQLRTRAQISYRIGIE